MARPPRQRHNAHQRNEWSDFFLGFVRTPRRLGFTLAGVAVLFALVSPVGAAIALNWVLNNVLMALLPIVILIGCILWGFKLILRPLAPKKKKDH